MFVVSSLVCSIASSNVCNVLLRMFGYSSSLASMLIFNGPLHTLELAILPLPTLFRGVNAPSM